MVTVDDLKFYPQAHGGIGATLKTKSKLILSIQAGKGIYSTPREDGLDPESYSAFELALIDIKGDFVTDKFLDCGGDKVAGWVSRERINDLINFLDQ
tara:strand:+ start:571 stop:861 length:291 start_codon:yes stop_codon:yes gene_type:complete